MRVSANVLSLPRCNRFTVCINVALEELTVLNIPTLPTQIRVGQGGSAGVSRGQQGTRTGTHTPLSVLVNKGRHGSARGNVQYAGLHQGVSERVCPKVGAAN